MLKVCGASCPKCGAHYPAEYAQKDQPARWTCHGCGAGGDLIGDVCGASRTVKQEPPKQVKPHWSRR